ncbi:hypothetical protein SMSP2_01484 [Limihaloglobus sulfuriphilus]|uniref:Glycoside hydrolase 123 catalytic domain-containing protein n=1 Tax=Limihaloglobus sulfuriphilus TaxID=1851148 RepID=A0A1Q2MEP0_9BACT|nr:glycoside hydrolase domain-containing protein [Limihaloglobus sulfuriphilus]AQQ71119.1 hypothetical protein SMSP2_01484 [Limihaloglobus sulfuriphilus]
MTKRYCSIFWVIFFLSIPCLAGMEFYQVETCEFVYNDVQPEPLFYMEPISTPRNSRLAMQFVIISERNIDSKLTVNEVKTDQGELFNGSFDIYSVILVPVEANSNSNGTQAGKPAQGPNKVYLAREAPFEVFEPAFEQRNITLNKDQKSVLLIDAAIPADCKPGIYRGRVIISSSQQEAASCGFSFRVHKAVMPESYALKTSHWLTVEPENLTRNTPPESWSQEHWQLIKNSAQKLYDFGDRNVTFPTIYGQKPVIQTFVDAEGRYSFDYSMFDKWMELFLSIGYEKIECLCFSGHWITPLDNIYAVNTVDGKKEMVFPKGYCTTAWSDYSDKYEWPESRDKFAASEEYREKVAEFGAFIEEFLKSTYKHISEKGWKDVYIQQLIDEPRTVSDYAYLSNIARRCMPDIKISNAIHAYGVDDYEQFSPLVDKWIMESNLVLKPKTRSLIEKRESEGKETGIYLLANNLKMPNRLLDKPLIDNRALGWILYEYGLESYIHWAGNNYRGADPYKTSVGPVPGGSQTPGHPVGCNWIFYPGDNGLTPSMRAFAFREGLTDYTLLKLLENTNPDAARSLSSRITESLTAFQGSSRAYHIARRDLLEILDSE